MLTRAEQGLVDASALGEMGQPMRDVALSLVHTGWPVFPCGLDKAPLVPTGFKARTKNVQQIEQWWALHPEALPAICPGDNELAALDIDSSGAWLRAETAHVSCLQGLIVESGGTSKPFDIVAGVVTPRHVYVRTGAAPKLPGVVVRYLAGYVIAPGARRGDRVYRVLKAGEPPIWEREIETQKSLPDVEPIVIGVDLSRLARIEQLVAAIPNPLENGREPYIAMAHMIHGALGAAGRDVFLEWAGRWPGKVNRAEDERVWDSLPASQLGYEDLWVLASRYIDTSPEQQRAAMGDFDILGPKPPDPEPGIKSRVWHSLRELQQMPELLAEPTPVVPFLAWPGRKTLFAGREKSGKSTLACAGIARATSGRDFLGQPTTPQRVLWVTEESRADITRRATEMDSDPDRFFIEMIGQDPWGDLATAFKETAPQVVVIDSLSWFAGLGEEQENSVGAWLPIFKKFSKLTDAGVALVLLHHSVKYSETGEYRGSTAIGANVDVILRTKKFADGSQHRSFRADSRMNIAKGFDVLLLNKTTGEFKLTQGVEEIKEEALEDKIITYLVQHPGASLNELKEAVGKRKEAVREALSRLGKRVIFDKGWGLTPDFEPLEAS